MYDIVNFPIGRRAFNPSPNPSSCSHAIIFRRASYIVLFLSTILHTAILRPTQWVRHHQLYAQLERPSSM
ncbi:hypothetical protein K449DRAFT_391180 [Hypoxylon sp. EC38]|nr:hypothetical protein K449DRAFT_391180 [Hypoxylon sp. EC38]